MTTAYHQTPVDAQIKVLTMRRSKMKHSKPAKAAEYTLSPHQTMRGGIPKLYT